MAGWVASGSILVLTMLGLVRLQRSLIFPRQYAVPVPEAARTPGLERWTVDNDEGAVEVWFLPGEGVDADQPGPAVVFAHGNAELIDHWPTALAPYRALGVSVLLPEYRGYGRSAGAPSEAAIAADFRAAHAALVADPRVDPERLVYHGRSLGGGAVCDLLRAHPPRALVLESTFASIPEVAGAPAFLVVDRFENLVAVRDYPGPVLVLHGRRDEVVPFRHGERLARAAPRARLVAYDAGHNDFPPPTADYWPEISRHLRAAGVLSAE